MIDGIVPDWPAPARVRAVVTTRAGGVSRPPWDSLNVADHVGDEPAAVAENRRRLRARWALPAEPVWLQQVHGCDVVDAGRGAAGCPADAAVAVGPGSVCAVLTADRPARELLAWLGPAIGPQAFEVGDEVRAAFTAQDGEAARCFHPSARGRWLADLYGLARLRLQRAGVGDVHGGGMCTFSDAARFYSYRRDGVTGRMASLLWLEHGPG